MEATIYLFFTSVFLYTILTLIVKFYTLSKGKKLKEKDLGIVMKQVVQKQEDFQWNGFPRQLMIYTIQAVLFSLLQFKNIYFDTWMETLSSGFAVVVMVLFPIFMYWLSRAEVMPDEGRFTVKPEARKLFENYKRKQKAFALMVPLRKFFMSIVIVIFKTSPTI